MMIDAKGCFIIVGGLLIASFALYAMVSVVIEWLS